MNKIPNHHKPLTEAQVNAIDFLKAKESELIPYMHKVYDGMRDERWMSIAKTHIQQGIMAAIRSICEVEQQENV